MSAPGHRLGVLDRLGFAVMENQAKQRPGAGRRASA
jgi:hypothetical protein